MALSSVIREAGPLERRQKKLKAELENTSRKPKDLVKKYSQKKVQLTLSQGRKKERKMKMLMMKILMW
jgi:hypothetical protein